MKGSRRRRLRRVTDDPKLAAEGELAMARLALDDHEYEHAAGHIAGAVGCAPDLPEVHEALAELQRRIGPRVVDLFPVDGDVYIGTVVARAHLSAALGQPGEALALLVSATRHDPGLPWAGVPWVEAPDLPGRVDPEVLLRTFVGLAGVLPDPVPEADRPPLLPYLTLARHSARAHGQDGPLLGAASAVGRRLGAFDEAVAWGEQAVAVESSMMTEIWLGYAYRAADRPEDAIGAWRRALEHDPMNLSIYADVANLLADMGRMDDAIAWAEQALAIDPDYDCAVHTAQSLRYRRDRDVDHLVALADFMREHPQESHEHNDLEQACRDLDWLGVVATPTESSINVLGQLLDQDVTGAQMAVTDLEVPSAITLMQRMFPGLTVAFNTVSEPDLRRPVAQVGVLLWTYDGTDASPVFPAPPPSVADRIRELAAYHLGHPAAAYDRAITLSDLPIEDLLGLLVWPPDPPDGPFQKYPAIWVKCVQTWACLGILHHRPDEPWPSSTRRRILADIAYGIEDWTTETALYALIVAAWVDPAARTDVRDLVAGRIHSALQAYDQRPVTIIGSLASLALATPQMHPALRERARAVLAED
jgi:tetratricopeptide (TPR) repeat protein